MCRPVENQDGADNHPGKVKWRGAPWSMVEGILIGIVDVEGRRQEARGKNECGGDCGLQRERTVVVADFSHGPEKRQRKTEVKSREQAHPEGGAGIPHIGRATQKKSPGQEPAAHVQAPGNTGNEYADRLAGNQKRTPPPQAGASEDDGYVT